MKINGSSLTIHGVIDVARNAEKVELEENAIARIEESRQWVENAIADKKVIYGITTGFGSFKSKTIDGDQVQALQVNLVRSHAVGVGAPLPEDAVRAAILIRVNSLIKGYSGVRREVIDLLIGLLNNNIYPYVPAQGSVGSSGDLAPLCHIMLVLLGEGECLVNGERVPSQQELDRAGLTPVTLEAKEGLALSNGTSVQTAVGALAVHDAAQVINTADIAAALSVQVLMGSRIPFNEHISRVRGQVGQQDAAKNIHALLEHSEIMDSHEDCDRVQDSYALRCTPQVHGAVRDAFSYAAQVVSRELNAATDNPLIFVDEDSAFSGGNFHGEPIAIAMDTLSIAVSEAGNIAERRIAKMVDPATSEGLPAFLTNPEEAGTNSGFMIPQYTAAALVSENKVLAHPASVDSIPTSANQEDHVSMGTIAARQAWDITKNVRNVLAIELMTSCQAYEFRKPAQLSAPAAAVYDAVRESVEPVERDRVMYTDMETIAKMISDNRIIDAAEKGAPLAAPITLE